VGEEVAEAVLEGVVPNPEVSPEGRHVASTNVDFGDKSKGLEASNNALPNGGVKVMRVSQISRFLPAIPAAKLAGPRSRGVRVKLGEEFGKESRVLRPNGEDASPPRSFGVQTSSQETLQLPPLQVSSPI
jgi:hypothetical protein